MTVLLPNQTLVIENDFKNRIFVFFPKKTPDVSTTFTSFTTFFCSPPLDILSHALTENFRDVYPLTELRGPVCEIFDKCKFVGKRQKIKGRAIKRFLFGSKSWQKEVGLVLPYRQNCAISSDELFVSISLKVRGWMVTYTDYFFGRNFFLLFCSRRLIFLVTHYEHATSVCVRFWPKKTQKWPF